MRALLRAIPMALVACEAVASEPVLLAALEEPQCKEAGGRVVRPLFRRDQKQWIPLDTKEQAAAFLPKKARWFATLDNKNLGAILSVDSGNVPSPAWTYPRDYWHVVPQGQFLPSAPNPNGEFAGWCAPPKNRPLALTSNATISDPEAWSKLPASTKDIDSLMPAFKASFKGAALCIDSAGKSKPYRLRAGDVRVITHLAARDGSQLFALQLGSKAFECNSELGEAMSARWFTVNSDVRYVGSDLSLLDASDYDGDGKTEFLFWYSGYNRDGYVLFSEHFRQRAEFTWNYH